MMEPFFFVGSGFASPKMWHKLFSTSVHLFVCSVKIILVGLEKISFHFSLFIKHLPNTKV